MDYRATTIESLTAEKLRAGWFYDQLYLNQAEVKMIIKLSRRISCQCCATGKICLCVYEEVCIGNGTAHDLQGWEK